MPWRAATSPFRGSIVDNPTNTSVAAHLCVPDNGLVTGTMGTRLGAELIRDTVESLRFGLVQVVAS